MVKHCFVLGVLALLTSCSSSLSIHRETLGVLFNDTPSVSLEKVELSEVDLLVVNQGNEVTTFALAFIEEGQLKWMSAKGQLLIGESGRWQRTVGMPIDLLTIISDHDDPLTSLTQTFSGQTWLRRLDFNSGQFGHLVKSVFSNKENSLIRVFDADIPTYLLKESVFYYDRIGKAISWENKFWFEPASGELIKSEQKLYPDSEYLTSTYLSRVARMLSNK